MAFNIFQNYDDNWVNPNNWSRGAAPSGTDVIIFATGTQSLASGFPGSPIQNTELRISSNYSGDIGTSTNSLRLNGSDLTFEGRGSLYHLGGVWNKVSIRDMVGEFLIPAGSGQNITNLEILGGQGTIRSGASGTIQNLKVSRDAVGLSLDLNSPTTTITVLDMSAGIASIQNDITTAHMQGGRLVCENDCDINSLTVYNEAFVEYNASGTIGSLHMNGGIFSNRLNPHSIFRITNLYMRAGTLDISNATKSASGTNPANYFGGTMIFAPNTLVSWD